MRRLFILPFVLLLLPSPAARAQEAVPLAMPAGDQSAIRQVIEQQLQAFQHDDGEAAFAFASPDIQGIFRDPASFLAMVRGGYMPVYRPREVEFRDIVSYQDHPTQRVLLVGPDNVPVVAYYLME